MRPQLGPLVSLPVTCTSDDGVILVKLLGVKLVNIKFLAHHEDLSALPCV